MCVLHLCCPTAVINSTTHTTVVTSIPQQYPRQQVATPEQPAGYQPSYQATPIQPGYGTQPMSQGYGAQPMPTVPYQGQPYTPGPPPTYQEASECVYTAYSYRGCVSKTHFLVMDINEGLVLLGFFLIILKTALWICCFFYEHITSTNLPLIIM